MEDIQHNPSHSVILLQPVREQDKFHNNLKTSQHNLVSDGCITSPKASAVQHPLAVVHCGEAQIPLALVVTPKNLVANTSTDAGRVDAAITEVELLPAVRNAKDSVHRIECC